PPEYARSNSTRTQGTRFFSSPISRPLSLPWDRLRQHLGELLPRLAVGLGPVRRPHSTHALLLAAHVDPPQHRPLLLYTDTVLCIPLFEPPPLNRPRAAPPPGSCRPRRSRSGPASARPSSRRRSTGSTPRPAGGPRSCRGPSS